jgi:hypothetical protein
MGAGEPRGGVGPADTTLRPMPAHGRSRRLTPVRRFVVADVSMEPALRAGQGLIGIRGLPARVGQIRCAPQPGTDRWVVKRVTRVDGDQMDLGSDNAESAVDSRHFGSVPVSRSYLVIIRVPLRWM